jgi:N-acetylmuramoyl-L-alanine amidase
MKNYYKTRNILFAAKMFCGLAMLLMVPITPPPAGASTRPPCVSPTAQPFLRFEQVANTIGSGQVVSTTSVVAQAPPVLIKSNAGPLSGRTILLDPGHGGKDAGAVYGGVREKDLTLAIVLRLRPLLEAEGAKVILTRDVDKTRQLADIYNQQNALKPDLSVSIHVNALPQLRRFDGIETYYWTDQGHAIASDIFDLMVKELGTHGNWVHKRDLAVVCHTAVPSTLVEVGYLTNPTKRAKLVEKPYQDKIVEAIAHGIDKFFGSKS